MSNNIQDLLDQLHSVVPAQHQPLLGQLEQALAELNITRSTTSKSTSITLTMDNKTGCYISENNKAYYCPHCYQSDEQRIKTKRLNSKLRVCPQCRASIKPQINNKPSI